MILYLQLEQAPLISILTAQLCQNQTKPLRDKSNLDKKTNKWFKQSLNLSFLFLAFISFLWNFCKFQKSAIIWKFDSSLSRGESEGRYLLYLLCQTILWTRRSAILKRKVGMSSKNVEKPFNFTSFIIQQNKMKKYVHIPLP